MTKRERKEDNDKTSSVEVFGEYVHSNILNSSFFNPKKKKKGKGKEKEKEFVKLYFSLRNTPEAEGNEKWLFVSKSKGDKKELEKIRVGRKWVRVRRSNYLRYTIQISKIGNGNGKEEVGIGIGGKKNSFDFYFYFYTYSLDELLCWKRYLCDFLSVGSFVGDREYFTPAIEEEYSKFLSWPPPKIVKFLQKFEIIDRSVKIDNPIWKKITGERLCELRSLGDMKDFGIESLGKRIKLQKLLDRVRDGKFVQIVLFEKIDLLIGDYLSISGKWAQAEIFADWKKVRLNILNPRDIVVKEVSKFAKKQREQREKEKKAVKQLGNGEEEDGEEHHGEKNIIKIDDIEIDMDLINQEKQLLEQNQASLELSPLSVEIVENKKDEGKISVLINEKKIEASDTEEETSTNEVLVNSKEEKDEDDDREVEIKIEEKINDVSKVGSGGEDNNRVVDIELEEVKTEGENNEEEGKKGEEEFCFPHDLPVKLVVSDMVQSNSYKRLRRLISPFIRGFSFYKNIKEFGIFHSAIFIGPWYLEWHDSSIVQPRRIYSKKALFCIDLGVIKKKDINKKCDNISYLIHKWNSKMVFDRYKKHPYNGNCQDFTEDLLETLGINKPGENTSVGGALQKMVRRGRAEMLFKVPNSQFQKKFLLKKKKFVFQTHVEIDEFYAGILKIDKDFEKNYPEEYMLLKSYDRAYWLRFLGKPFSKTVPSQQGCPFGEPSFVRMEYPFFNDVKKSRK